MGKVTLSGLLSICLFLSVFNRVTLALYESQVGQFDWHHTWIGHPQTIRNLDDNHVLIYTQRNVLASLDKNNGNIQWRHILENDLLGLESSEAGILTVSHGSHLVQFWNKTNGQLVWDYAFSKDSVPVEDNLILWKTGESTVLLENHKVIQFSPTGQIVWTWTKPEREGDRVKMIEKEGHVYIVVEPSKEESSPFFFINIVHKSTGETEKTLQIHCHSSFSHITYVGHTIFWMEENQLKWTPMALKDVQSVMLEDLLSSTPTVGEFIPSQITLSGQHHSLLLSTEYEDETYEARRFASALIGIEEDGKSLFFKKYFDSQPVLGAVDFSETSTTRAYRSGPSELYVYVSPEGREMKIEHDFELSGEVETVKVLSSHPFQLLVVTEGSSLFCYNENYVLWSREESLASITASEFLELPEQKMWSQMVDESEAATPKAIENSPIHRYLHRLSVHMKDLGKLPSWVISHFAGMYSTSLGSGDARLSILEAQSCWLNQSDPETLYRDNFGLRKLLISVTRNGKIVAQDTTQRGKIVWSRYAPHYSFDGVYVVRTAHAKLPPIVVAYGSIADPVEGEATGFIRLNALTGDNYISTIPEADDFFEPVVTTTIQVDKVVYLPIEEPEERTHLLAIYEANTERVYIYPDTTAARERFASEFLSKFYLTAESEKGLKGFKVIEGYRGSLKVSPVWNFILPKGETLLTSSQPQAHEKVALLGRALGNRNVLYKYLNPNMISLVSRQGSDLKVRIIDSVKGSLLYETLHENVDTETNKVHIIQSENWFVYHFWSNDHKAKGYQAAVLELYEGKYENERIESGNFSSYDNVQPHVQSAVFAFPYPVNSIGLTHTKNGISTKAILFGLPSHQIFSVNKRLLDPRRPRDKPSKDDMEEMLIPYAPIPDEKRLFLSYNLQVAGIQSIVTSPSLLESTSLVFAYGLDTFFTRSSPSRQFDVLSEDFSKVQLLLTMVGLVVTILVTGPIVRRKRVNALWK
ncbi:hypothetical protein BY458DRAFT_516541 [Sporodiniella umbellata]|nr:hypothetical protein BY458DRAFT_516541 [Sporodiniella umbellata]